MSERILKSDLQKSAVALGVSSKGTKRDIAVRIVQFGYNAVEDKGRRQAPQTRVKHESRVLTKPKRKKLQATTQDQNRNHSLIAWAVRKHLDYVSAFHFDFRTGEAKLDAQVARIFRWHGSPLNFDVARRLGRDEMFRMFEMEKVLCGDAGLIKAKGMRVQALESDLIAKGTNYKRAEKLNDSGLVMSERDAGRVLKYSVCSRGPNGRRVDFDHLEPAENVIFDAYWTRFSSQFRGVSPLSTAINMVQDLHEGLEFNVVKAKMHALFGIAILREATANAEFGGAGGATAETADADETATDTHLDLDPRLINLLDLNPGEKVEILESKTPSSEFVAGSQLFIQIALLALDIPITCFDSRKSSFSARIADLNEYEVSAGFKRDKNRYCRQDYSDWVLKTLWNDPKDAWGLKKLADAAKMNLREVQSAVEWIPAGAPWLDKFKQLQGDAMAISIGVDNAIDACRRRGGNFFRNIDKQAEAEKYAVKKGVALAKGMPGQRSAEEIRQDEEP